MTIVYFIRHAEPNYTNHDDQSRELTAKGLQDSKELVNLFQSIPIDAFYSSPYKRSIDTIKPLAHSCNKHIQTINDLRERKITDSWIEDFNDFTRKQWGDFSYKLPGGESLQEVQNRNIATLQSILKNHPNQTIVVGTHGTALATILHYYNPHFGLEDFNQIKHIFPYIVCCEFEDCSLQELSILPLK
ncbi:histidine phosphatase family protein [Streptococcus cameli]